MKAILVIDMPEYCGKCPCYHEGYGHCSINFRFVDDETQITSWCPLKPMPSRRKSMVEWVDANVKTHDITEYDKGWNDCVEFLKGEDND